MIIQYETQKNDFYLEFQPIIHVLPEGKYDMTHFEVLLRSRQNHRYPEDLLDFYISCEERNHLLVDWYAGQLMVLCEKYPQYTFNYNIHPQQFIYESTWRYLDQLKDYSKQIHIEITEKLVPVDFAVEGVSFKMETFIQKIHGLSYKVSIDDVATGQNTLELVMNNIDCISSLKLSLLSFNNLDVETLGLFLDAWQSLAQKHGIKFIVEGVESQEASEKLFERGIVWQQGYYWAKSVEL
ncbi:EAL domain-containing protein [Aerococcaceae bacterium DSM 111021]|nr:EAL domain-containing protein [Aerococcaceae bacterium DSM 111021]